MPAENREARSQYKWLSWQDMQSSGRHSLLQPSWAIRAATLALAGGFQFSPLKERCLKQCHSPFSFFVRYYRKGAGAAWRLSPRHGLFCLGCCWALMLVMFGLEEGSMVSMTGVMVLEKTFPSGQRLSPFIGIALLLLAILWLVHPAWLLSNIRV